MGYMLGQPKRWRGDVRALAGDVARVARLRSGTSDQHVIGWKGRGRRDDQSLASGWWLAPAFAMSAALWAGIISAVL